MKSFRLDSISVDQTYYTEEGYLVDHPIVTTCGIFEYKDDDGSTRRELRLPEYVFDKKSLASYKGKPIIITHDAGGIDKDNVKKEQIGTIMSEGYRDGDSVRCEIIIHDTNSLKSCGLKELSLGYSVDKDETPGVYRGEKYDCIQKNIEINHLAIVCEARAGDTARLNIDGKDGDVKTLKGGLVMTYNGDAKGSRADGTDDLTPEEMEAAIELFKAQRAASQAAGGGMDGSEEGATTEEKPEEKNPVDQVRENVDRRDSEKGMAPEDIISGQKEDIETLLKEIEKMQAASDMKGAEPEEQNPSGEGTEPEEQENKDSEGNGCEEPKEGQNVNMDSVEKAVQERFDVYCMASKLKLDGFEKISTKEGKKRIIKAVNPSMNLDGKDDTYIDAAYDVVKQSYNERKSTDEQRQKIVNEQMRKDAKEESGSVTARKKMINRMTGGNK